MSKTPFDENVFYNLLGFFEKENPKPPLKISFNTKIFQKIEFILHVSTQGRCQKFFLEIFFPRGPLLHQYLVIQKFLLIKFENYFP